jgi:hypothetical protein
MTKQPACRILFEPTFFLFMCDNSLSLRALRSPKKSTAPAASGKPASETFSARVGFYNHAL